jgi:peptidoglycan/LPS O-acetylase OafA/YrhL
MRDYQRKAPTRHVAASSEARLSSFILSSLTRLFVFALYFTRQSVKFTQLIASTTLIRDPAASSSIVQADDRKFFANLESLRGLAALSVVVVHCIVAFALVDQNAGAVRLVLDIANGRNAVVLFFVLSGFVLSESLAHGRSSTRPILVFISKRLFRMLPLAYVGLILSAVYLNFLYDGRNLSDYAAPWFLSGFYRPGVPDFIANALFISNRLNVVYWTLAVELLASLVFVPLFFLDQRLKWIGNGALLLILLLLAWSFFNHLYLLNHFLGPLQFLCGYFFCFQIGIIANRQRSHKKGRTLFNPDASLIVLGLALLCLAHSAIADILSIPRDAGNPAGGPLDYYEVVLEALGSGLLVYGASGASSGIINFALGSSPLRYLGAISYPIYAIHLCILKPMFVLAVTYFGGAISRRPLLGPLFALGTVIPLSIIAAHILHKLVEVRGIELGRKAIKKFSSARNVGANFSNPCN